MYMRFEPNPNATLTFVINAYQNYDEIVRCLKGIRGAYQDARIVVCVGHDDAIYDKLRKSHSAEVYYGDRLSDPSCGGDLLRRELRVYELDPTDYLFHIDSDTTIARPFRLLPTEDCFFGTRLDGRFGMTTIHEGLLGMTAGVVKKLISSKILEEEKLKTNPNLTWGMVHVNSDFVRISALVGWASLKLDIPVISHPEVFCVDTLRAYGHDRQPSIPKNLIQLENKAKEYVAVHPSLKNRDRHAVSKNPSTDSRTDGSGRGVQRSGRKGTR